MKLWIARDLDGTLALHESKPIYSKQFNLWQSPMGLPLYIDDREFPKVTFENSPQQVEIKLI